MNHTDQDRHQTAGKHAAPPAKHDRRHGLVVLSACLVAALALGFASPLVMTPLIEGDGGEYLLMLQALLNHGSPDLWPADIEALNRIVPGERPFSQIKDLRAGFVKARNGRWYSMHFWLYPLLAVPAGLVLNLAGVGEISAFQVTNTILFILTVSLVLCCGHGPRSRRLFFLLLSAVGPVLWFLRWPHPEVFTWCCAVASLSLLGKRQYGWATTTAALGATQNPPLILLALLPAAVAIGRRQGRMAIAAAAGLLPAFIAPLFYLYHYGTPSLIAATGGMKLHLISLVRTRSVLFDFNQGMLPHVPLLVLLGLFGAVIALVRRRWEGIGLIAVTTGMVLLIQTTPNWNSDSSGMMRYAVWITPLFAWLAAEHLRTTRWPFRTLVAAGLLLQAVLVCRAGDFTFLQRSPLATRALDRFPALVHPEPEIFTERQMRRDGDWRHRLPAGFVGADGSMIKMLVGEQSLERVARRFGLEGEQLPGLVHRLGRPYADLLYLHPPRGMIKVVEPVGWGEKALRAGIHWELAHLPGAILGPEVGFSLKVTNTAAYRFWGESSGARHPLTWMGRIFENGEELSFFPVHLPLDIAPGETVILPVRVTLPRRRGTFVVELQAALKQLVRDGRRQGFSVEVLGADDRSYLARVVRDETETNLPPEPTGGESTGASAGMPPTG